MNAFLLATAAWFAASFGPAPAPNAARNPAPNPALNAASNIDELHRERLPADIDLVVHFDFEGFKSTELWKRLSASAEGHVKLEDELGELNEIKTRFGIDPLTDVRAVTLFKVKTEEDPTVVLFSTTPAIDEALRRFQAEPGYARETVGGIVLHTWKENDDETVFAYLHTGEGTERVLVLAANQASALRAARVLRGEEPNHAQAGVLNVTPAKGSFLYIASDGIPDLAEHTPASQVFGLAQGIQVDLGEAGGLLRGHMGVLAGSAEDALNISNVVNGLISLARLAGQQLGEALELLTGLRVNSMGNQVTVDFEYGVGRLFEILEALDRSDSADETGDDADH